MRRQCAAPFWQGCRRSERRHFAPPVPLGYLLSGHWTNYQEL